MAFELRPISVDNWDDFSRANAAAFGWEANPEVLAENKAVMEFDRTLATFDGPEIVSTTAIHSYELTVPGNTLPAAGVTWVSVSPTHRRLGILRDMMRRQLSDVHERGEPLAALWASESIIYGRFGYGLAAENQNYTIDRLRTGLAREIPACGRMRLVTRDQALAAWPAIYDDIRPTHPGFFGRSEAWWQHMTLRGPDIERRMGSRFFVQYEVDGELRGFARYRIRPGSDGMASGTLLVQELIGTNDEAHDALWQYIFGVDLITTIEAAQRPADEPLFWQLADPRRLQRRPYDSLWLRIVDVPPALEGRRYPTAGKVVLDVRDPFCSWNEGRYELEAGVEGARCRRTDAEADIVLSAADLGAVYLGGARLTTLKRAGRVEGDDETLRRADAMFSWDPAPWCPEVF